MTTIEIPAEVASHVLWFHGHGGTEPSEYLQHLIGTIDLGVEKNLEAMLTDLSRVYPDYVAACRSARGDGEKIEMLKLIASSAEKSQPPS